MPASRRSPAALTGEQMEAWRSFLRAHDTVMRELDGELREAHDITISEFDVLVQLSKAERGRMRMRDLARATLFSPSGLTRVCERLERLGFVERQPSADDLRGTEAVITRDGAARLRRASETHVRGIRASFADLLSPDELRSLGGLLERIAAGRRP